jgi:hypothetical protein
VTTAQTLAQCSFCQADVPLSSTYEPFPGNDIRRCLDTGACQKRQLHAGTNTEPGTPSWDRTPLNAAAGRCGICHAASPPGGVYERSQGVFVCLDRPGCDARSVETQFLTSHGEDFADAEITSAELRAAVSAAGAAPAVARAAPDNPFSAEAIAAGQRDMAVAMMGRRRGR